MRTHARACHARETHARLHMRMMRGITRAREANRDLKNPSNRPGLTASLLDGKSLIARYASQSLDLPKGQSPHLLDPAAKRG